MNLSDQNTPLRTPAMFARYQKRERNSDTDCFMCKIEPIVTFVHWQIIPNQYPYDAIAKQHDMLVPKRHIATHDQLTMAEMNEFWDLRTILEEEDWYDAMLENLLRGRSHTSHYHWHLLQFKRT